MRRRGGADNERAIPARGGAIFLRPVSNNASNGANANRDDADTTYNNANTIIMMILI